ncbi:unnamed protein product [Prorocentrum cordatum]|uniref:BRCA1-associated 2/ETP1 RRM domain-containing protein n=1 Tax=Prorocentrum cordatum TaxID=2364126 RepID=A0ABN9XLD2_9DINO|nr:unnamed protein product [Polarella glacialis]
MDPAAGSPRSDDDAIFEYWAGNPTVEISHGHICVARGRRSPGQEQKLPRDALDDHASGSSAATSSSVVLASAVPCYMSASEFCEFVGAFSEDSHRWFRHCRVLHGRNPEEYMIACWLASPEAARAVIRQHDGRPYNTIEAGVCQLHPVVGCLRNNWLADEQSACSRNCGPSPEKRSSPAGSPAPDFAALGAAMAQEVGRSPARRSLSPASRAATRRARRASRSPALEYAMPHPVARSPLPLSPARAPAQARLSPARAPALARELRAPELAELDAPFLADPRDLFAGCAAPQADGAGLGGSACTPGAGSALAAGPSPMVLSRGKPLPSQELKDMQDENRLGDDAKIEMLKDGWKMISTAAEQSSKSVTGTRRRDAVRQAAQPWSGRPRARAAAHAECRDRLEPDFMNVFHRIRQPADEEAPAQGIQNGSEARATIGGAEVDAATVERAKWLRAAGQALLITGQAPPIAGAARVGSTAVEWRWALDSPTTMNLEQILGGAAGWVARSWSRAPAASLVAWAEDLPAGAPRAGAQSRRGSPANDWRLWPTIRLDGATSDLLATMAAETFQWGPLWQDAGTARAERTQACGTFAQLLARILRRHLRAKAFSSRSSLC